MKSGDALFFSILLVAFIALTSAVSPAGGFRRIVQRPEAMDGAHTHSIRVILIQSCANGLRKPCAGIKIPPLLRLGRTLMAKSRMGQVEDGPSLGWAKSR